MDTTEPRKTRKLSEILATPDDGEPIPDSTPEGHSAKQPGPPRYGRYYWCVEMSGGAEVYLHADRLEVTHVGALVAWCDTPGIDLTQPFQVFACGVGMWRHFFAASVIDGCAVAVEHWDTGESGDP